MTPVKLQQGMSTKMRIFMGCCMLLGVCLLALYIQQKNRVQQAVSELSQLQRDAQRIVRLRRYQHPSIPQDIPIQTLLKVAAENSGIRLGAVRSDEKALEVMLPPQPVKPLLLWLENLQHEYGIRVDLIDLSLSGDVDEVVVKKLMLHVTSIY